ncbi:DUF6395 domain-containing protein [Candidatus Poseidoniaceae archaeon]|nr:DUF6395 domain-containing protein [Candidatus Poseidoniaceae archaeon]
MNPAPPVMRTLAMTGGRSVHDLCFVAKSTHERGIIINKQASRQTEEDCVVPISALRRWRIRRLYNNGEWKKARQGCEKELSGPNHDFAAELVVRCFYNERSWQGLIDFTTNYPESDSGQYTQKAKRKVAEELEALQGIPEPMDKQDWNAKDLLLNWSQEGQRLWLRHPWGWVHWDMPVGYQLNETHPSLLHLALEVLLSPWVPETKSWKVERRNPGENDSLSFSGGVDSTAAMILMPQNTILAYHERNFTSMINHSLPHSTFRAISERTDRKVLSILSNHERIRTYHGKPNGFSTDHAAGVHLILLSDFLSLKGIAFGTPIDNTWLKKGLHFRQFSSSDYWLYWSEKFDKAGLSYDLVINHLSEGGTLEICRQSMFSDVVNSCLRGKNLRWCGKCWKCFHKNGPLGRSLEPHSKEIIAFLNKSPLRSGVHALWALKNQNLGDLAPRLLPYLKSDFSWWIQAYPPGLELIRNPLRSIIKDNTERFLEWMEPPFDLELIHLEL